jgi:cytochrome c oxidase assembly protein subunit 15
MAIVWTALEAWRGPAPEGLTAPRWRATGAMFLAAVYLQCLLGALVAGNHAGLVDADWPLMAGRVFPSDYWQGSLFATLIRGAAAVQFNHRLWAYGLLGAGLVIAFAAWRRPALRVLATVIAALLLLQVGLGVATLLLTVPLPLALAHQFTAVCLLTAATAFAWRVRRIGQVL